MLRYVLKMYLLPLGLLLCIGIFASDKDLKDVKNILKIQQKIEDEKKKKEGGLGRNLYQEVKDIQEVEQEKIEKQLKEELNIPPLPENLQDPSITDLLIDLYEAYDKFGENENKNKTKVQGKRT